MQDWGLKECINPHMILAPKIVRTYSIKQVFWLSLLYRPSQPEHRPVAHLSGKGYTPLERGWDYSGGSAPDSHGIPLA